METKCLYALQAGGRWFESICAHKSVKGLKSYNGFLIPFLFLEAMYYCYILYSKAKGCFYKGQTDNLKARVERHNSGMEKSTSDGVPWVLCWAVSKPSRSEAMKLESKLKNLSRKRLLIFMMKYQDGIVGPDELLLVQQLSGC